MLYNDKQTKIPYSRGVVLRRFFDRVCAHEKYTEIRMNKHRFAIILAVVCLLAVCFALVACDNRGHVHKFGKFEVDENEHWRICGECGEKGV